MITTSKELKDCLSADALNFPHQQKGILGRIRNRMVTNPINDQAIIWQYIKTLRYNEYFLNNSIIEKKKITIVSIYFTLRLLLSNYKLKKLAYKTGFQIPPNTIGKGLTIWHFGYIIVNPEVKIGESCTLYPGVEIGHKNDGTRPPIIGNNCFIGAGAKIIGQITIGDNVTIAPNAVVTHDIPNNTIVGGIPARIIKNKS